MPGFIPVGNRWLNVDAIETVDVEEDTKGEPCCVVHFSGGATTEFAGDDAKKLIEALKKQKPR